MKKILPIFIALTILFPASLYAALVIKVNTLGNVINAIEGTVRLPEGFKVGKIYTGESAILFWIALPIFDEEANTITFAGLTPGGFSGVQNLFTIESITEGGLSGVSYGDVRALSNDGDGTRVEVALLATPTQIAEDFVAPEAFDVELSRDASLYDGNVFATFYTHDKQSGVAYYEVSEQYVGEPRPEEWVRATSPHLLDDQLGVKRVYVRATDMYGNQRVESQALRRRHMATIFLAIIIGVLCLIALRFRGRQ